MLKTISIFQLEFKITQATLNSHYHAFFIKPNTSESSIQRISMSNFTVLFYQKFARVLYIFLSKQQAQLRQPRARREEIWESERSEENHKQQVTLIMNMLYIFFECITTKLSMVFRTSSRDFIEFIFWLCRKCKHDAKERFDGRRRRKCLANISEIYAHVCMFFVRLHNTASFAQIMKWELFNFRRRREDFMTLKIFSDEDETFFDAHFSGFFCIHCILLWILKQRKFFFSRLLRTF